MRLAERQVGIASETLFRPNGHSSQPGWARIWAYRRLDDSRGRHSRAFGSMVRRFWNPLLVSSAAGENCTEVRNQDANHHFCAFLCFLWQLRTERNLGTATKNLPTIQVLMKLLYKSTESRIAFRRWCVCALVRDFRKTPSRRADLRCARPIDRHSHRHRSRMFHRAKFRR